MKINSNTFKFSKEEDTYKVIEEALMKLASDNNISNVREASIRLDQEEGLIVFAKEKDDDKDDKDDKKEKDKKEKDKDDKK